MPRRQHILEEWNYLASKAIPPEVGALQRKEMEKSFFSGAFALYTRLMRLIDSGPETTKKDLDMMKDIDHELRSYFEKLKREGNNGE